MTNDNDSITANSPTANLILSRNSFRVRVPELSQVEAEQSRRSLRFFLQAAWPTIEPGSPFVAGWHIDAICEHLEAVSRGQIRNLLINMPPRHSKSSIVSVAWPAWLWITHPERKWLCASYSQRLSTRDSVSCRRLIESAWYQEQWGHVYRLTDDQNAKERYENTHRGVRISTSVGGTVLGEGGDILLCDDPQSADEAMSSDAARMSVLAWWQYAWSSRLNDPKTSAKVVVMQRLHQQDLSGHLLEVGGFEHLCLPAEYERSTHVTSIGWSDPRTEQGELLWPDRFGRTEIDDLKNALGSYAASGQLQQRPSPEGGGLLKRHWWRYWKTIDSGLPPVTVRDANGSISNIDALLIPHRFDEVIQSWDCTFKDLQSSDYVVGQVWGRKGANSYLLDQVRARLDLPGTLNAIRGLTAKWPNATRKLIEDKANGSAVIQTLKNEIAGLIPVNPEGGKVVRAQAVSAKIESGNVYLPHPALYAWVAPLVEECAAFPHGRHDDSVDSLTQALVRLQQQRPTKLRWA